ncbi:MAG: hypothetical protein OXC84_14280, partial [Gammaproteobacteria bacterium]|nr:hypothetical protein [Gammaproteobacteria bacterium]
MLERFESWYLVTIRVIFSLVVLVAFLTFVGSILWYGLARITSVDHQPGDYLSTPTWEEVRLDVLPLASTLDESLSSPEEDQSRQTEDDNQDMTTLVKVGEYLDQQFERDENLSYTKQMAVRILDEWITRFSGVPAEAKPEFLEALVEVSREIGEDPMINRISSPQERMKTVNQALEVFADQFSADYERAIQDARAAELASAQNLTETTRIALLSAGAGLVAL